MKKELAKLTESEELVMKSIWDCQKEPVLSDVVDRVNSYYGKDWKRQTVSTFLARLVDKHYLKMQRNGKIYTYKILVAENDYIKERLQNIITYLYKGNIHQVEQDIKELENTL